MKDALLSIKVTEREEKKKYRCDHIKHQACENHKSNKIKEEMSHQMKIFVIYVRSHHSIGWLMFLFTFKSSLFIKEVSTYVSYVSYTIIHMFVVVPVSWEYLTSMQLNL